MSYIASYLNKDDEQQNGVNTSGVVDGVAGAGTAAGAAAQPAKDPGTGFVNLGQYLTQNQGVGAGLAQNATADVTKAVNDYGTQAKTTLDQAKTGFENTANGSKAQSASLQGRIGYDATANIGAAKDFLGSGYGGPTADAYTTGLESQKNQLTDQINKVDDSAVQQANLQKAYGQGGKQYTQGFGLLDSFLMNGDQSGRQQLDAVKAKANDVAGTYNTAAETLKAQEGAARKAVDESKKSLVDAATTEKTNRDRSALYQASIKNQPYANQERNGFQSASLGDVLTDDQIADIQALSELSNVPEFSPNQYNRSFNEGQFVRNVDPNADLSNLVPILNAPAYTPPKKPTVNVPASGKTKATTQSRGNR